MGPQMTATIHTFDKYRTERDEQDRVEQAEISAGWYFEQATKRQKAEFDASMQSLLGCTGPKWDRARDAARAKWTADTAEARKLFDASVEEFLSTGELSEALDGQWTALIERASVHSLIAAE
jgi:hypothetical protein